MAKSQYEYVKQFEVAEKALLNTWMVVRLDGHAFSKFTQAHDYEKPSDLRGIKIMNKAARSVLGEFPEIVIAYGQSDEYSFIFPPKCKIYGRKKNKIVSTCTSLFSSAFVYYWSEYFPTVKLKQPPVFDGRMVCYPTLLNMRDYLNWRQADCHINNLYNTVFWALVQKGGMSQKDAEVHLKGSLAGDKNEILFQRFDINYSKLPEVYRKGTTLHWVTVEETLVRQVPDIDQKQCSFETSPDTKTSPAEEEYTRSRRVVREYHGDIIKDTFWDDHPNIAAGVHK